MGRIRKCAEFVQPIFEKNDWRWALDELPPSTEKIVEKLKRLKKDVKEECGSYAETGRLRVTFDDGDYGYYLNIEP